MAVKSYELHLSYFKQGDDLYHCWEEAKKSSGSPSSISAKAFLAHAEMLDYTSTQLRHMAEMAEKHGLEIEDAQVHFIRVQCDEELGEVLCKEERLTEDPFDEDCEDEEFEDGPHTEL